jgi:SAM-dependent methyltransferase
MKHLKELPAGPKMPALGSLTRRVNQRLDMWGALRRNRHRASDASAGFAWDAVHYNRIALINRAVAEFGPGNVRYLEIGCQNNLCFDAIIATDKTGVDPASGGTHRMTSDTFFAQNRETFDIIFIDGLHAYEQVQRDVINALACLRVGGLVFCHDLLPNNWIEEMPPALGGWLCGDGWKVVHELNASSGLTHCVVRTDHGVGVIRKDVDRPAYVKLNAELGSLGFDDYVARLKAVNIVSHDQYLALFFPGARGGPHARA